MDSITGFILLDKPKGPTSHDMVDVIRRVSGEKRVGHAGTLDPFASGLLVIGITRAATKQMSSLSGLDKTYQSTFVFGARSNTDDETGALEPASFSNLPSESAVREVILSFVGEIEQSPPTFSAVKVGGKKMYEAARKGQRLEAKSRNITVYSIEIGRIEIQKDLVEVDLTIHSSTGTYIRALARDMGEKLEIGGYVKTLRRLTVGPYSVQDALDPSTLTEEGLHANVFLLK